MADKMMRIAGRGEDGLAKGLRTDNDGNLLIDASNKLNTSSQEAEATIGQYEKVEANSKTNFSFKKILTKKCYSSKVEGTQSTSSKFVLQATSFGVVTSNGESVLALNLNGDILWDVPYNKLNSGLAAHTKGLVVDDEDNVYVGTIRSSFTHSGISKISPQGEVLWEYQTQNATTLNEYNDLSVKNGKLYGITRGNKLVVLDSDSGIEQHYLNVEVPTTSYGNGQIEVDNAGGIYITHYAINSSLVKYVINSGALDVVWSIDNIEGAVIASIGMYDDRLFAQGNGVTMEIDKLNSTILKEIEHSGVSGRFRSTSTRDNKFAISGTNSLLVINLDSLEVEYKVQFPDTYQASHILTRDNLIFFADKNGTLFVLNQHLTEVGRTELEPLAQTEHFKVYDGYDGYTIGAMLHDTYFLVKRFSNGHKFYVAPNGLLGDKIEITLPSIGPGWYNFVEHKKDRTSGSIIRLVIFFNDGIYYNYADYWEENINSWAKSDIWGLPNIINPHSQKTTVYQGLERQEMRISNYDMLHYMGGAQHWRVPLEGNDGYDYQDSFWFASYHQKQPSAVFMTRNGKDIYCQYMYGINREERYIGGDIDTSQLSGTVPADLKIRKITPVIPNKENQEPTEVFNYGLEIAVSSVVQSSDRTLVTANSHGLKNGDVIHFMSSSTSDNSNNWLEPQSYNDLLNNNVSTEWADASTPPMGNGKVYQVKVVSANQFYLHEALGNPHNHLYCTHIHSLDVVPNGIVVSTGESGETSNITYLASKNTGLRYLPEKQKKRFGEYDQVHLTANPETSINGAIQRPLGFYMTEDYYIFASDEHIYKREVALPPGRTPFGFRSSGIYKGKLSEIDDWSKARVVYQPHYVAYMFKRIGDVFITCDVSGVTNYSVDEGETWKFLYQFDKHIMKYQGQSKDRKKFLISGKLFELIK